MDDQKHSVLATLGPMLPLLVASAIMRGVAQAAERAGCGEVSIGSGLQIHGILPEPGASREEHLIQIGRSRDHEGLLAWECSCLENADSAFGGLGGAVADAVDHVPADQHWNIEPGSVPLGGDPRG